MFGVGYHHAGMDVTDRKAVETLFTAGELPVLCKSENQYSALTYLFYLKTVATSTLAMGVSSVSFIISA